MIVPKSYYELLGVGPTADLQTLKKAFYRLSKTLHPDTTLLPVDEAARKFCQVCEAYEFLSDPIKRRVYDETLKAGDFGNEFEKDVVHVEVKRAMRKIDKAGHRRQLSGGELFSLMLLCIAILMSLLLAVGIAILDGQNLQVSPSWLHVN